MCIRDSSKPEYYVKQILDYFNLKEYFDEIVGSEMNGARTNKTEVIEETLKRLGLDHHREQVIMVGDKAVSYTHLCWNCTFQSGIGTVGGSDSYQYTGDHWFRSFFHIDWRDLWITSVSQGCRFKSD